MGNIEQDFIFGKNKNLGSYGVMGFQWGFSSDDSTNSKRPTNAAPFTINTNPIGLAAIEDDLWKRTYGASMDSFLSLVNGDLLNVSFDRVDNNETIEIVTGVVKDSIPHAVNINLYNKITESDVGIEDVQQVQYAVSKDIASDGASATDTYGDMSEIRTIGLRFPSIAAGWGRNVNLTPTDTSMTKDKSKNFRDNEPSHKLDRATWSTGPVDWRWDSRRQVWATYNDMIVDGELDTLIFNGTNQDADFGFPFIKTGWSDAFRVRALSNSFSPGDQTTSDVHGFDFDKTGVLLTHLNHKWLDLLNDTSAELSTVFSVPHTKAQLSNVGGELLFDSDKIDFFAYVHFNWQNNQDGPILFTPVAPLDDCDVVGDMVFLPSATARAQTVLGPLGDNDATGVWAPRFHFDACDLLATKFETVFDNDITIAEEVVRLCSTIYKRLDTGETVGGVFNPPWRQEINGAFGLISLVVECLRCNLLPEIVKIGCEYALSLHQNAMDEINDVKLRCCPPEETEEVEDGSDTAESTDVVGPPSILDTLEELYPQFSNSGLALPEILELISKEICDISIASFAQEGPVSEFDDRTEEEKADKACPCGPIIIDLECMEEDEVIIDTNADCNVVVTPPFITPVSDKEC